MRSRRRRAATLATAVLLVGCQAQPNQGEEERPESLRSAPQTWTDEYSEERLAEMVQQARDSERKLYVEGEKALERDIVGRDLDIPLVRVMPVSEWASQVSACLEQAGFSATPTGDGTGLIFPEIPTAQGGEQAYALFKCNMQYPMNPLLNAPLPAQPALQLWEHLTTKLKPCLESFDVSVPDPPSREVWLQAAVTTGEHISEWEPMQNLNMAGDYQHPAYSACPQFPENFFPQ